MLTSPPSNSASLQSSPLNTPQIRGSGWVQEGRPGTASSLPVHRTGGRSILRVAALPFSPAQAPLRASPRCLLSGEPMLRLLMEASSTASPTSSTGALSH